MTRRSDHPDPSLGVEDGPRMDRAEVVQPAGWPRPSGYANGMMRRGRVLAVAGQIGWDPVTRELPDDFTAQARQALANVLAVVRAAGGDAANVIRLTWYVTDRSAYLAALPSLGRAYRELFEAHYPAMAVVVVAGLVEERAVVEIEGTAVL